PARKAAERRRLPRPIGEPPAAKGTTSAKNRWRFGGTTLRRLPLRGRRTSALSGGAISRRRSDVGSGGTLLPTRRDEGKRSPPIWVEFSPLPLSEIFPMLSRGIASEKADAPGGHHGSGKSI